MREKIYIKKTTPVETGVAQLDNCLLKKHEKNLAECLSTCSILACNRFRIRMLSPFNIEITFLNKHDLGQLNFRFLGQFYSHIHD